MKNVTTRRLGGFTQGLFKPSWSVWRPAGFQDLPCSLFLQRRTLERCTPPAFQGDDERGKDRLHGGPRSADKK